MASIVRRRNSFSVVYYTTAEGQRKQKWEAYHSLEEAQRRRDLLKIYEDQRRLFKYSKVETVEQLMYEYIRLYGLSRWSLSTYQGNYGIIQNYIIPNIGTMRLRELSPRVVAEIYRQMQQMPQHIDRFQKTEYKRISTSLLRNIHKILHSAAERAIQWEYMTRNPFHGVPMPKSRPQPGMYLEAHQIVKLLECCENERLKIAILLAFVGTLRKGELLALTWADVDFGNGAIHVNKTISRVRKEALELLSHRDVLYVFPAQSSASVLVLKQPKTDSSIRTVYLPGAVMESLKRRCHGQPMTGLIFSYSDGRPLQEKTITKWFYDLLEQANLPRVTFHSLRHSSITYKLIITEGNIKAVQGDSGHAQAEMVTEVYGHILDTCRKETAKRFENAFFSEMAP